MIYLDEKITEHPKLLRAGDLVGVHGVPRAFYVFVSGIRYARQHLTDGVLPAAFVRTLNGETQPDRVVKALISAGLWDKVEGGYAIHDFLDWNRRASTVKAARRRDRQRKHAEREHSRAS